MSAKNRAGLIEKLFKVAKKHYTHNAPPSSRSVLEHMVYGCVLENSTIDAADESLAKLQENFCDWNEVRVTTADELAEVGGGLAMPQEAAVSVKRTLFGIFETYFAFDIDFLRKENIGKAVQSFENFKGVSPFVVSYAAQNGLGGHSIALDRSMISMFYVLGIVTEAEAEKGRVPGIERTISKSKGAEFFGVVHQLAVAFSGSPFSKNVRDILLSINSEAKERFPKRASKKKEAAPEAPAAKAVAKKEPTKKADPKPAKAAKSTKKAAAKKAPAKKSAAKKAPVKKKAAKKPAKMTKAAKTTKKATKKTAKPSKKKSPTKRLSKKKPR